MQFNSHAQEKPMLFTQVGKPTHLMRVTPILIEASPLRKFTHRRPRRFISAWKAVGVEKETHSTPSFDMKE